MGLVTAYKVEPDLQGAGREEAEKRERSDCPDGKNDPDEV